MQGSCFDDYVHEFRSTGVVAFDVAALILHGDGESDSPRTFVTAMGQDPARPSLVWPAPDQESLLNLAKAEGGARRPSLAASNRQQDNLGAVFRIAKRPGTAFEHISVGRTANLDVVLPLPRVSKFHAYFNRDVSGQFTLADAGSTNGTWVGAKLLSARTPEVLQTGARVRLGPYSFTFTTAAGFEGLVRARALGKRS